MAQQREILPLFTEKRPLIHASSTMSNPEEVYTIAMLVILYILYLGSTLYIHSERTLKIFREKATSSALLVPYLWIGDIIFLGDFPIYLIYSLFDNEAKEFSIILKINYVYRYYQPYVYSMGLMVLCVELYHLNGWKEILNHYKQTYFMQMITVASCSIIAVTPWLLGFAVNLLILFLNIELRLPFHFEGIVQVVILSGILLSTNVVLIYALFTTRQVVNNVHERCLKEEIKQSLVADLSKYPVLVNGVQDKNQKSFLQEVPTKPVVLGIKDDVRKFPIPEIEFKVSDSTTANLVVDFQGSDIISSSQLDTSTPPSLQLTLDDKKELFDHVALVLVAAANLLLTVPFVLYCFVNDINLKKGLDPEAIWGGAGFFLWIYLLRPLLTPFLWSMEIL